MSENILSKKIYSEDKVTGQRTQVYPETNTASIVDFDAAVAAKGFITSAAADTKIETAIGAIDSFTTPAQVDAKINTALGGISTSTDTYTTLNNFDFNAGVDALADGSYIVTNATNIPFGNETSGILKVMTTTSNTKIQTWNGKLFTAFREVGTFNPVTANMDSLQVNDVDVNTSLTDEYNAQFVKFTYEQKDTVNFNSGKIMWLYPGKTYKLSGVLVNCQIRVGYLSSWYKPGTTEFQAKAFEAADDESATTTIILDNFYLKMDRHLEYDAGDEDSWTAAFEQFSPLIFSEICGKSARRGKLVIQLADGSKNYLVRTCDESMETANNKWGVIYSEQDLDITGNGSLGIADGADNEHLLGCHAIKAKGNLRIINQPHIAARAYHDLLHGNDGLYINGGYFQALYCNDVLGTDTSLGDQAISKIRLYNAVFDVREAYGTFIQADNVIVYPNVTVSFNKIGEGLFLQCKPGFYKGEITKKGQIGNFNIIDYSAHKYYKYEVSGVKLDAAVFESYIEDVANVTVYTQKEYKNASKFNEAVGKGEVYVLVNDEYVQVEVGTAFDPEKNANLEYYKIGTGPGAKVMYNGAATDIPIKKTTYDFPGIIVYDGITVVPDIGYSYSESDRNTHVTVIGSANLINSAGDPAGGYNGNFAATATSTEINGELTVAAAEALLGGNTNALADANFSTIDFTYSGTASGGIWNVGVSAQELTEYKNEVDYLLTCVKGMLVPPKEIEILDVTTSSYNIITGLYDDTVTNLRTDEIINDGDEIPAHGFVYNEKTGEMDEVGMFDAFGHPNTNKIKTDSTFYSSKTGLEPIIKVKPGEAILVKAKLLPEDATNYAMKWSVVGKNDWVSLARLVTDDTMGCWVRGIQAGDEDIIVSAKALDKNNSKLKITLHFIVGYTVTFSAGANGVGSMAEVNGVGGTFTLPECTFEPSEDYTAQWPSTEIVFTGWSINDGNQMLPAGTEIAISGDTTLTANWGPESPAEPQTEPGE